MMDESEFDFDKADEEFYAESPTPILDEARERGEWESPEERDKALEEATDEFIKAHVGTRVMIKYIGGFYHGTYSTVRKPLKKIMEVAKPPKETSPGCFTNLIEYEAYYLRVVNNVVYYVEEHSLMDFANEHG